MNNSEHDNSPREKDWQSIFEGAELKPNGQVWAGLHDHLATKARQRKHRRFTYLAIAASLIISCTWGIVAWNQTNNYGTAQTASVGVSSSTVTLEMAGQASHHSPGQTQEKGETTGQLHLPTSPEPQSSPLSSAATGQPNAEVNLPLTAEGLAANDEQALINRPPALSSTQPSTRLSVNRTTSTATLAHKQLKQYPRRAGKPATRIINSYNPSLALKNSNRSEQTKIPIELGQTAVRVGQEIAASTTAAIPAKIVAPLPIQGVKVGKLKASVVDSRLRQQPPVEVQLGATTEETWVSESPQKWSRTTWITSAFTPSYFQSNIRATYEPPSSVNDVQTNRANFYDASVQNINKIQQQEDESRPNFSYSFGITAGTQLSKRWQIEGGIQYIYNSSDLQTQVYVQNTHTSAKNALIADLLAGGPPSDLVPSDKKSLSMDVPFYHESATQLNPTSRPLVLKNEYQYIALPIKVGYQWVPQEKLHLIPSAGVSTDIFLHNTLSSSQADVVTKEISASDHSAYKSLSFSGLFALGVQYDYSRHFCLLAEPTYRAAILSTTKSSSNVKTLPNNAGLSIGVKYIF